MARWLQDRAGEHAKHIARFSTDLARDARSERTCGFGAIGAVQIGMQEATGVQPIGYETPPSSANCLEPLLLFQAMLRIATI